MIIPTGQIFMISSGTYSNYCVNVVCKAKVEIDCEKLMEEYIEIYPGQKEDCCFEEYIFIKWLIVDKGVADEIPCREWHIENYAGLDCKTLGEFLEEINERRKDDKRRKK